MLFTIYLDFKGGGRAVYENVASFRVDEFRWELTFANGEMPLIITKEVSVASVFSDGKLA